MFCFSYKLYFGLNQFGLWSLGNLSLIKRAGCCSILPSYCENTYLDSLNYPDTLEKIADFGISDIIDYEPQILNVFKNHHLKKGRDYKSRRINFLFNLILKTI